ncbi:hypothetical protein M407DRAFT_243680 [Tulasnella calospora MUT 4182]|uniref:Uncharacterized protein n=1 Tax=Tulasnella calospora MUT 4182 TaxID=1051891 RepID=A0A0C3QID1_9AGAM|nr:hypothetical protein M407DRAFT_243680 [Tulasnella calospora MUT 4182]
MLNHLRFIQGVGRQENSLPLPPTVPLEDNPPYPIGYGIEPRFFCTYFRTPITHHLRFRKVFGGLPSTAPADCEQVSTSG